VEVSDVDAHTETFNASYVYDNLNQIVEKTDERGVEQRTYDSRALLVKVVNESGNTTCHGYDGLKRLVLTRRYLAVGEIETGQTWDKSSRLTSQTDDPTGGGGNTTTYAYDEHNRKISETYADASFRTYSYNFWNDLIGWTDPTGTSVVNTFDSLGRLITRNITRGASVWPFTTSELYKYDGVSNVVHAEDNDSIVVRTHDSLKKVLSETLTIEPGGAATTGITTTGFDGVGNNIHMVYPGGRHIDYTYDLLRMIDTIIEGPPIADFDYIGPTRVEKRRYPRVPSGDTVISDYFYDLGRRMTLVEHARQGSPAPPQVAYSSAWDASGNMISRVNLLPGSSAFSYTYDAADRLVTSVRTPPGPVTYTLDDRGTRTSVTGGPNAGPYTMNPTDAQMNQYSSTPAGPRLHDFNGNVTDINTGARTMAWDYRNQLASYTDTAGGGNTLYRYDPFGRRIEKKNDQTTTRYFYDGLNVIEEQDAAPVPNTLATYVYARLDRPLQMRRGGADHFYLEDANRNIIAMSDTTGVVVERYEYDEYGAPEFADGAGVPILDSAIGNDYLFTSRRYDPNVGFYYYRTRYYDVQAGRFTNRDTIGIWEDDRNIGNGFTYVANNPASRTDPLGECPTPSRWRGNCRWPAAGGAARRTALTNACNTAAADIAQAAIDVNNLLQNGFAAAPADAANYINWFGPFRRSRVFRVNRGYQRMNRFIQNRSIAFRCRATATGMCGGANDAWVFWKGVVRGRSIYICPGNWPDTPAMQAMTIVHEVSHLRRGTFDLRQIDADWGNPTLLPGLAAARPFWAVRNADSWHLATPGF
jgi:RHS repeat-associated protein